MRVQVSYLGEPVELELNPQGALSSIIELACSSLQVPGDPKRFALYVVTGDSMRMLTAQDLASQRFALPAGSLLKIRANPKIEAQEALANLTNKAAPAMQKKAVFDLAKTQLTNESFAQEFLELDGLPALAEAAKELSGNALAYCLAALDKAVSYDIGWEAISDEVVERLLGLIRIEQNGARRTNIINSVLRFAAKFISKNNKTFEMVVKALETNGVKDGIDPFEPILSCLSFSDLDTQTNALVLINAMIGGAATAGLPPPPALMKLKPTLQKHIDIKHEDFRRQLYIYQQRDLQRYDTLRAQPYNKSNPDHEAQLMLLWKMVFPDVQLESRVSEQWKKMGFQGTDPATDFRGMGLLGLQNLMYFAETYPEIFRKIVKEQSSRSDLMYPVAVVGISITATLHAMLGVNAPISDTASGEVQKILFDHANAFEEIYCITFQMLDRTWDEMHAGYMDFPKVMAAVKERLTSILPISNTVPALRRAAFTSGDPRLRASTMFPSAEEVTRAVDTGPDAAIADGRRTKTILNKTINEAQLAALKGSMAADAKAIVAANCIRSLHEGATFREWKKDKKKDAKETYYHLALSPDERELQWTPANSANAGPDPHSKTQSMPVEDIKAAIAGANNAQITKVKKADDELARLFTITFKESSSAPFPLNLIAPTREVYVQFLDGLHVLLGQELQCAESLYDVEVMSGFTFAVKMINLEGATVPTVAPPIPPPPSTFEFYLKDNKELELQEAAEKANKRTAV